MPTIRAGITRIIQISEPHRFLEKGGAMEVQWSNELTVGIESLDAQHEYLIGLLNDFIRITHAREFDEDYQDLVFRLISSYQDHFKYEEDLMRKHQYPDASEHETDHSQFIVLINMMSTFHYDEVNAPDAVEKFIRKWLSDHLMEKDKALGMYLNERGVY
ncbi:MAG: bacteriohemerythrin [Desulfovibrio sp.]|nr:bacteriohemerythrin [Desulfovibrio sp.]MBI4959308.1 bacteriohemerythrin [Desulfovibrio sp.]